MQAGHNPAAEAAVLGCARWTYLELQQRINALARALLAAGVRKGDRVATLQTPHPQFIVCLLASTSIGAIWVGLNPKFRLDELKYIVADAQPKLLITRLVIGERSYADDLRELASSCRSLERTVAFEGEAPHGSVQAMDDFLRSGEAIDPRQLRDARERCGGRDPCVIVYTSGSTGKPKGALLHHEGICSFCVAQNSLWPVEPLRVINYFPINHIGCVLDLCLPCLAAGGTSVFMEQFDAAECMALMARERITMWATLPAVFSMQLALPEFDSYDLSALQLIVWEGAALPVETIRRLLRIGPRLATNYGMTETASAITAIEPIGDEEILADSVGHAFPGTEVRLVDRAGRDVLEGSEGEVLVRSTRNLLGYWQNPQATEAAFTGDGFFRTGDIAMRRPDGRYRLVGRLREMFKSGGYNVYPREIENVIEAHAAVSLAAVVSVPDTLWQEVGVAFVVPKTPVTAEALLTWCRERLANYKVPKHLVICDDLPLLPIGKVDKAALRSLAAVAPISTPLTRDPP